MPEQCASMHTNLRSPRWLKLLPGMRRNIVANPFDPRNQSVSNAWHAIDGSIRVEIIFFLFSNP